MRWILTDHAKGALRDSGGPEIGASHTGELRWLGSREEDALFDLDRALSRLEEIDRARAKILGIAVLPELHAEETAEILDLSRPPWTAR